MTFDTIVGLIAIIPANFFPGLDLLEGEKRDAGKTQIMVVDENVLYSQIGIARVVEKPPQIPNSRGVVNRDDRLQLRGVHLLGEGVVFRDHGAVVRVQECTRGREALFEN